MLSEISKGNNGCHLEQSSFVVDPNCTIGSFSASLQSPQPFDIKDDDASWRMAAFDVSGTDVLVNGFDSVSITESVLPKEDDKCKDSVKDYHAFRSECPDNECITPRRRSSRNRIQNLATVRARSGMRIAIKKEPVDLSSLQITRKRRSYFSKQARSSVWGLLENLVKSFKHNVGLEIASCKQKSLRRATKSGRENDKHGKNQIGRRSRKSKGKSSIPTGPISLKVKFGSHCLMDVIPLIDNDNGSNKDYTTENEMKKLPKIASNVDDKLGGRGNLDNESVSLSYGCQPGKNAVQDPDVKTLVCHDESPSEEGRLIINGFSDPGTSPDSEVINLIPDTPVSVSEDLHDLTLSNRCAAPGDTPVLRLPKFSNCGVKDLLSPESMSNTQVFGNLMQGEAQKDGSCCSDISVLTTAGNGPGYMFSTESPESGLSEKLIASPVELKVSNRGILNVSGKCKSEVSKSSSREGYKKKGNEEKEDIVHEVKHKNDLVKGLGKATQHSGTEIERSAELGQVGSENKPLDGGISNLDILQNKMGGHLLPQRNAWVQCDDCLKWRRIPSLLADQIEETNCRWTCKDNLDRAFDSCSFAQEKSNSEINAELEISEGSGEEDVSRTHLSLNGPGQKKPLVAQQSCWSRIKSNLFLHRNRKNQTIDEIMVCHCKPPSDGRMGCGDVCLNRMLNIECARGTCPCGELCSNRQFQKRNYAKLKCFKYGKKGYGLQLLEDVSEGQFLIEYVGEVLDMQAYEARQKEYALKGHKHFYFMTLNGSEVIDACAKGNLGRFINHSCDPNCRTEKWMVNGEVCIGLFALRNIKKGEEVTFDYNYVRVFGAAVKKCVCGSPHCRRYIGGDPLNAEVIVQDDSDDEYPEPAVLYEDSDMDDKQDNIICTISSIGAAETKIQGEPPKSNGSPDEYSTVNQETSHQTHASSVMGQENVNLGPSVSLVSLNVREESGSVPEGSPAEAETSGALKASECLCHSSVETSLSLKVTCETMSGVRKECLVTGKATKYSFPSPQESEIASGGAVLSKSLRKSKSSNGRETPDSLKSCPLVRTLRKSSSVKKGKQRNNATVNSRPPDDLGSKLLVSQSKFKKPPEGSSHGHFEAVEEKLNELLDHDGGICKRKDASRSYLKLLLLTAASGDGCNGEAIQSNRDLSMILDAILKTKSRKVLTDIINKNGLQMLHNIMKRYRREFNKIPILRKLLKVLEYLAVREILSHEHINGAASRAGVESFRDSILGLTDHIDKQVHQIARNFRVRWLPRPPRKRSNSDRKDSQNEMHSCSQYKNNRCRESQNQPCDLGGRQLECTTVASVEADTGVLDGSAASCSDIGRRRKRKHESQWDGDADNPRQVVDDDEVPPGYEFPPGFSSPILASSDGFPCGEHAEPIAIGHLQQRFISQLPVSYGIPFPKVQQFGCPQNGRFDAWSVAPGIPFQPFPPLPPYPRGRRDLVHQNPPSIPGPQRDSYNLGNKYFWKPKFNNNHNNNGLGPPRFWGRSGWEWQERNKTTAFAMQGK